MVLTLSHPTLSSTAPNHIYPPMTTHTTHLTINKSSKIHIMNNNETLEKLKQMRLGAMAQLHSQQHGQQHIYRMHTR